MLMGSALAAEDSHVYSEEFLSAVRALSPEDGRSAVEAAHLVGPGSRIAQALRYTIPEIEHLIGPLRGLRVLDFGCGTGSTMVALAEAGAEVWGFDIDPERAAVARLRLAEHRLDPTRVSAGETINDTELSPESFDVVLMNAVVEHIPKSVSGLRLSVMSSALGMVRPGGYLAIAQSPNRLWPRDIYLSGKWLLPWTRPGSRLAYRRMVSAGYQRPFADEAEGREDLERRGLWGFTFWEIRRCLGPAVRCVNLLPEFRGRSAFTHSHSQRRRRIETMLSLTICRAMRVPVAAVAPFFWPLVFEKGQGSEAAAQS